MSATLALDTCGRGGQIAVAREGELLAAVRHDERQGHAESLSALIDQVLADADLAFDALERIAVVRGPGSFTGLRIGIMSAKAIAFARGLPLASAPTLALLASATERGPSLALLNAGGGHAYAAIYDGEHELLAPARFALDVTRELCARYAIASCVHADDEHSTALARQLESPLRIPVALGVQLARRASLGAWPVADADPFTLVPEYLAPSQAERTHGLDLSEQVHTPGPVEEWE